MVRERMLEDLRRAFRPELLNRIDEIIVFDPLTPEEILQIVDLMLGRVQEQLDERHITLQATLEAKELLAREGFDPEYGARPLRRTIQRMVENPVARGILQGEYRDGDTVELGVDNGQLVPRLLVATQAEAAGGA